MDILKIMDSFFEQEVDAFLSELSPEKDDIASIRRKIKDKFNREYSIQQKKQDLLKKMKSYIDQKYSRVDAKKINEKMKEMVNDPSKKDYLCEYFIITCISQIRKTK
jgi:hypothetical protein